MRDAKLAATIAEIKVDEKNFDEVSSENESEATERVYTYEQMADDLARIKATEDMYELIELTKRPSTQVRLKAAQ